MAHIKQVNLDSGSYLIEPTLYAAATVSSDGKTYTASFNTNFELVNGVCVQIKCPNKTNTAPTTFNTKNIYYNGEAIASNTLKANHTYALVYDGTQWQLVGDIDTNTTYTNGTGLNLNLNNGEFSVKYGNEAGTAVQGNDTRLSDARTPTSHSHGNITNDGKLGSTADYALYTTTGGTITAGSFATTSPTADGTALAFITSVSQDSKGKISASKATVGTFIKSGSSASAGLVPKPSTTEGTTKFLREDATWQTAITSITIKTSTPLTGGSNTATTTTGTYTIGFDSQNANTIFAGPSSGNAAVPTFRALTTTDIPDLSETYLPLLGGTMQGQIQLASSGYKTSSTSGYSVDQYGNFLHLRNTSSDYFQFKNSAGTGKLNIYWETGNVTAAGTITATEFSGSGASLTSLDGSNISTGTVADARIASTIARLDSPAFTGTPLAPTAANGTNTTQIATTAFVNNTLSYINAMQFKGTLGTGGTVTALPVSHEAGDTYRVITPGTWAGKYCEVGTLIICIKDGTTAADADWTSVETNEDGAVISSSTDPVDNAIVRYDGTTGRIIQKSGVSIDDSNNMTIGGTIYFGGNTSSGKSILGFSSTYPKYGIWYKDDTNDIMSFSSSGNADSGISADLGIQSGKIYNKGNIIPHTGNNTGSVGGTTTPVYVDSGKIKALSYTIAKSVPSDAKFTDTTSFTITANATDGLWDLTGTNGTNAVTYALAPYSSKGTTATFYTAETNPTLTTRLNYDGYLYATKLYSGGTEVSVSGHTHTLSIAEDSGTNALTLVYGKKYKLTAGGSTYIFTMPASDNTWRPIGTGASDAMAGNTNVKIVQQTGITTSNDYPILFKNGANTTNEAAGINYSNNINEDVTKTLPITINPSTGTLNVPQIKISTKSDSYGLFPHTNNYNQIGSTNLYWYRAYITNYYGTTSNITNWVSGKNIGTPCTKSAASVLGSVNFYNTCIANGTQTKTLLTANSATNSDITLTFPTRTGLLALTTDEEIIIGTQTGKTGNWTGTSSNITALYDGLTIKYYLNRDPNSNASLNLTLADGTTTGAIPCYYNSGRLTTHYAVGSIITLTYFSAGSITVNGTATTDDRWIADANYDSGNTNTATIQKVRTTNANYSLLFADPVVGTADNNTAYYTYRNDSIYVNPSTGNVYATAFNGSGASLTSLNASNLSSGTIGNARLPARLQEYHTSASNDTTACGWYYGTSGSPFSKYHTSNTDFMVWTHGYDTNWASEIGTDFRSNRLAVRNKNNGTWNSWRELAGNDDIVNEFSWTSDINYDSVTNTFTNTRANNNWASQVYSKHGFSDGCYVSWKTVDATHHMMIGLNSDPTTNANWTGLDYAWYMQNNGAMDIRESNSTKTPLTGHTTYAAGDDFRIEYNNGQIRYYHNGVCCRTVERAISGQLYLDSSLYNGGTVTDLRFGPITNIGTISIAHGGTGATDASGARTNLGLGSIATYSAATAGTKDTWGLVPVIGASDGVMEVGKYIDFHTTDGNTKDYDVRITAATTGLTISGTTSGTFSGSLTGNADTATTATNLSAAPTITQTGTATVNLAANTTYTLTVGGKSVIFKTPSNANTDTLVNYTLGATTKAYLMASQNAPTSTTTARAAHGDTLVYLTATSGQLSAKSYSINDGAATPVEKVRLEWNATDQSLDFIFA